MNVIETIDMTPAGLKTPEGVERVNKAVAAQEQAIVRVANTASQFIRDYGWILENAAENYRALGMEHEDARELLVSLKELRADMDARAVAGDQFVRALCGRPERD